MLFRSNLLDCIGWVRRLKEHEPPIPVFFEQEHLNTLDNTSNIILFVLAMVAEEESHMKSEAMLLSLESVSYTHLKIEAAVSCLPERTYTELHLKEMNRQ